MRKFLLFLLSLSMLAAGDANAATARAATNRDASNFISTGTYENLYPYMNNKMRTNLNPGTTGSQSQTSIASIVRTSDTSAAGRRVVSRAATSSAPGGTGTSTVRSAAKPAASGTGTKSPVARSATPTTSNTRSVVARSSRGDSSSVYRQTNAAANATDTTTVSVSMARCLADYTTCMNGYCERSNTDYNRCYCSSRLAQIDAQYQPAIDELIKKLLTISGTNTWTAAEMDEYWQQMVGQYTGDNSWKNIENALDIDWSTTESRVRGQQAFITGHDYCMQHLTNCAYMSSNMRDAYRSDIARDCATYESGLRKIKNAAESLLEAYSE